MQNCTGCGICVDVCDEEAICLTRDMAYPETVEGKCNGCLTCYNECPFEAIEIKEVAMKEIL
jgi:MinD superfamily P-loop ATPase